MDIERGLVKMSAGYMHYRAAGHGKPIILMHTNQRSSAIYPGGVHPPYQVSPGAGHPRWSVLSAVGASPGSREGDVGFCGVSVIGRQSV